MIKRPAEESVSSMGRKKPNDIRAQTKPLGEGRMQENRTHTRITSIRAERGREWHKLKNKTKNEKTHVGVFFVQSFAPLFFPLLRLYCVRLFALNGMAAFGKGCYLLGFLSFQSSLSILIIACF